MRSWLSSPAAQLLGFLASIVTLIQLAVAIAGWVCRVVGTRPSRVTVWTGLLALGLGVVAAPVEWPRVMAQNAALGERAAPALYPFVFIGPGIVAALALLLFVRHAARPGWFTGPYGVASLWIAAALYATGPGAPVWGLALAFAAPVTLAAAYVLLLLTLRATRRARIAA
jgi:hypothetical protein